MRSRPTIKDVAAAAGVSVGTVSNVLNRPDQVQLAYRARVEAAITALNFVPDEDARRLRSRRPPRRTEAADREHPQPIPQRRVN